MSDTSEEAEVTPVELTDEQKAAGYPGQPYDEQRAAMDALAEAGTPVGGEPVEDEADA